MKSLRTIFALLLLCFLVAQVSAQGYGEVDVIVDAVLYDDGNGTGTLELKISGDLDPSAELKFFVVEGSVVANGGYASDFGGSNPGAGSLFTATIPLNEKGTYNDDGIVDVEVSYRDANGQLVLSRKRAKHIRTWEKAW